MIELKKEVNALCLRQGEPRRYPLDFEQGGEETHGWTVYRPGYRPTPRVPVAETNGRAGTGEQLYAEIQARFGLVPNFFRLAPDTPEVTAHLWRGARSASLDNPLPSLFKERLFVYLSRFCEVRYCVTRHVGFLLGLGRPAGKRIWFEPYPTPLRDRAGRIVGGINMLVDITERKRAEEASLRLAAIVESSEDAILSQSVDGLVTSWNAGAERLFGYRAEEMIGQPILRLLPEDRHAEEDMILARLRRGERIDHFETVRRTKDGRLLNVSVTISPLRDARGVIIGASKIARDITARKRAEEERERLLAELRRINAELQQFAYIVSHDLSGNCTPGARLPNNEGWGSQG